MIWVDLQSAGLNCDIICKEFEKLGLWTFPGKDQVIRIVFHHEITDAAEELIVKAFEAAKRQE